MLCVKCNIKPREKQYGKKAGYFYRLCWKCRRPSRIRDAGGRKYVFKLGIKVTCEMCGFVAKHPCQLDIDHIDGNHGNNSKINLQVLCANCHRLKSFNQQYSTISSPLTEHCNDRKMA